MLQMTCYGYPSQHIDVGRLVCLLFDVFHDLVWLGYGIGWLVNGFNFTSEAELYTVSFLYATFTPLLGFFNAAIYFYPRYSARRQRNPELPKMACVCHALGFDGLGERLLSLRTRRNMQEEQKEEERLDEDVEDP